MRDLENRFRSLNLNVRIGKPVPFENVAKTKGDHALAQPSRPPRYVPGARSRPRGSAHRAGFRGPPKRSAPAPDLLLPPPGPTGAGNPATGSGPLAPWAERATQPRGAPRPDIPAGARTHAGVGAARPGRAQGRAGTTAGARAAPGGGGGGGSGEGGWRPALRWWWWRWRRRLRTGLGWERARVGGAGSRADPPARPSASRPDAWAAEFVSRLGPRRPARSRNLEAAAAGPGRAGPGGGSAGSAAARSLAGDVEPRDAQERLQHQDPSDRYTKRHTN